MTIPTMSGSTLALLLRSLQPAPSLSLSSPCSLGFPFSLDASLLFPRPPGFSLCSVSCLFEVSPSGSSCELMPSFSFSSVGAPARPPFLRLLSRLTPPFFAVFSSLCSRTPFLPAPLPPLCLPLLRFPSRPRPKSEWSLPSRLPPPRQQARFPSCQSSLLLRTRRSSLPVALRRRAARSRGRSDGPSSPCQSESPLFLTSSILELTLVALG